MVMDAKAQKEADKRSRVQFQILAALTRAVQVEATAYCLVDEREAARESLWQFFDFIENNRLNDRNTLVLLSQFNTANQGQLIDGFVELQKRISAFSVPEDELIALPKDSWTDTEKDDINGTDL